MTNDVPAGRRRWHDPRTEALLPRSVETPEPDGGSAEQQAARSICADNHKTCSQGTHQHDRCQL